MKKFENVSTEIRRQKVIATLSLICPAGQLYKVGDKTGHRALEDGRVGHDNRLSGHLCSVILVNHCQNVHGNTS